MIPEFEKFFSLALSGKFDEMGSVKLQDRFEDFSYFIHGYHILEVATQGKDVDVYFVGVNPPVGKEKLPFIEEYIGKDLNRELKFIEKNLKEIAPDIVNISGSESIDENIQFFLDNKFSQKKAELYGEKIFKVWESFWKRLILNHPKTRFIVSAGNGGVDWIGDKQERSLVNRKQTTPGNIGLKNITVVGSKKDKISSFSNFGSAVGQYMNGEQVSAEIPCLGRKSLKLTGTSQATAVFTNTLLE